MLNIPETVKALYKQDGVRKNFRAYFPNGELSDITNENIVQESVKFSESVCSQDVFKFGLTEASVIEFETVGVANMYGMTIECFSEIDCSSLTAGEKADIAAGTWDGTWDGVNEVFAVPYGTFRVESCPRDHQAMAHRKVTAYGDIDELTNDKEEEEKTKFFFPYSSYTPNAEHLFCSNLAKCANVDLRDFGYTRKKMTSEDSGNVIYRYIYLKRTDGSTTRVRVDGNFYRHYYYLAVGNPTYYIDPNSILELDTQDNDYETFIEGAVQNLEWAGIDYELSGYASMRDIVLDAFGNFPYESFPTALYPLARYVTVKITNNSYTKTGAFESIYFLEGTKAFYGEISREAYKKGLRIQIFAPHYLGMLADYEPGYPRGVAYGYAYGCPSAYLYTKENTSLPVLKYSPTLNMRSRMTGSFSSQQYDGHSYSDAYSYADFVNGWLELTGRFATTSRTSGLTVLRLSNSSPVAFTPNEYSQMWFDEYNVEPIGTIRYSYTDEAGEEQIKDYKFGDGASIYDMTDNAVLKAIDGASPDVIESLLDTYFVPHLSAVNFTPIDLAAKGLPYIEAGDALAITAQDGTVCNSYALRQEISGIQSLTAQIDSQSGLIIDSEEGT